MQNAGIYTVTRCSGFRRSGLVIGCFEAESPSAAVAELIAGCLDSDLLQASAFQIRTLTYADSSTTSRPALAPGLTKLFAAFRFCRTRPGLKEGAAGRFFRHLLFIGPSQLISVSP